MVEGLHALFRGLFLRSRIDANPLLSELTISLCFNIIIFIDESNIGLYLDFR